MYFFPGISFKDDLASWDMLSKRPNEFLFAGETYFHIRENGKTGIYNGKERQHHKPYLMPVWLTVELLCQHRFVWFQNGCADNKNILGIKQCR